MKYVQPYGITDPNAGYINGDPSIARQGSIPPAEAFEHPMRELVAVISKSKITPDPADLMQVAKGVRSQAMNYGIDTGAANSLSVALDPPLGAYTVGLPIRVKVHSLNTGAATIDAGAGRVPIRKPNGAEVAAGDLPAAGMIDLVFDGTVFQMINFGGAGGGGPGNVFLVNVPYTVDTSGAANTIIANFSPAITGYVAGMIFMVKIANTNNALSTINVNGLGPKPIYAQGGQTSYPLLPGDLQVNDVVVFVYDGTAFWINANITINQSVTFNVSTVQNIKDLMGALGRKRISTLGFVNINMAAGIYTILGGDLAVITTYHVDSDRMALNGTMQAGQTAPTTAMFQRSGPSAAQRASDSAFNITMLRSKYATEIRMPSTPAWGLRHTGPGKIGYQNLLVTGPNSVVTGCRGISADSSAIYAVGCSLWGIGDAGYTASGGGGYIQTWNSHACACGTRGFAVGGGASINASGGGSYGNTSHGIEAAYGGAIITGATDGTPANPYGTLPFGFQASCNAGFGASAQSGNILSNMSTLTANGSVDMYAFNMGTIAQYLSSVGTMSPAANTEGNLNSISVNYG